MASCPSWHDNTVVWWEAPSGLAFPAVNQKSSLSAGQGMDATSCAAILGLPPSLLLGMGAGGGCSCWRCKATCGSLAQPMPLPVPGQQPRRFWIYIPIPMGRLIYPPVSPFFTLSGSIWFHLSLGRCQSLQGALTGAIPAIATAVPHRPPCSPCSCPCPLSQCQGHPGVQTLTPPACSRHCCVSTTSQCAEPQTPLIRDV